MRIRSGLVNYLFISLMIASAGSPLHSSRSFLTSSADTPAFSATYTFR